jgi:hypothetical protein
LPVEGYVEMAAIRESLKRAQERNNKSGVQTSGSMTEFAIALLSPSQV